MEYGGLSFVCGGGRGATFFVLDLEGISSVSTEKQLQRNNKSALKLFIAYNRYR